MYGGTKVLENNFGYHIERCSRRKKLLEYLTRSIIMFKLNIRDMLCFLVIMVALITAMFGLDYLGFDLAEPINLPINIPSGDNNPSMSPTGAMSGTIG